MPKAKIVKLSELKKKRDETDRRQYQRVLMSNILGAFAVIDRQGLLEVNLLDVSESGVRFSMPKSFGMFRKGETLAFRLYFTQHDYIPLIIKVARLQPVATRGTQIVEYGCQLEADEDVKLCMQALIFFVRQYTQIAAHDEGDRRISLP